MMAKKSKERLKIEARIEELEQHQATMLTNRDTLVRDMQILETVLAELNAVLTTNDENNGTGTEEELA